MVQPGGSDPTTGTEHWRSLQKIEFGLGEWHGLVLLPLHPSNGSRTQSKKGERRPSKCAGIRVVHKTRAA